MPFKPFCDPKANSAIAVTYEIYSLWLKKPQPKQTRKQNRNCSVSGWKKGLTEKCT